MERISTGTLEPLCAYCRVRDLRRAVWRLRRSTSSCGNCSRISRACRGWSLVRLRAGDCMLRRSRRAVGSESASEDRRRFRLDFVFDEMVTVLAGKRGFSMVPLAGTVFSLSPLVGTFLLLLRRAVRCGEALASPCRGFLDALPAAGISCESRTFSAFLFRERTTSTTEVLGVSMDGNFCCTSLPTDCSFETRAKLVMLAKVDLAG